MGVFLRNNSSASRSRKSWDPHLWALGDKDVQQHDGLVGGLERLSQGQTGTVYHEKLTSVMEGGEAQQRMVVGEVLGLSVCPEPVEIHMDRKADFYIPFSGVFGYALQMSFCTGSISRALRARGQDRK